MSFKCIIIQGLGGPDTVWILKDEAMAAIEEAKNAPHPDLMAVRSQLADARAKIHEVTESRDLWKSQAHSVAEQAALDSVKLRETTEAYNKECRNASAAWAEVHSLREQVKRLDRLREELSAEKDKLPYLRRDIARLEEQLKQSAAENQRLADEMVETNNRVAKTEKLIDIITSDAKTGTEALGAARDAMQAKLSSAEAGEARLNRLLVQLQIRFKLPESALNDPLHPPEFHYLRALDVALQPVAKLVSDLTKVMAERDDAQAAHEQTKANFEAYTEKQKASAKYLQRLVVDASKILVLLGMPVAPGWNPFDHIDGLLSQLSNILIGIHLRLGERNVLGLQLSALSPEATQALDDAFQKFVNTNTTDPEQTPK